MPIHVSRTLEVMAGVYRASTDGGARSARFHAYVEAAAEGPIHGYNPMTSKPVLDTVLALLDVDAEGRLEARANETALHLGYDRDDDMHITVATPGMWTDRVATDVEHRLLGKDPGSVLWWFDDPVGVPALDAAIVAQTVRLVRQRQHGAPATLLDAVRQEGTAGALAGLPGKRHPKAAEALDVLRDDTTLSTMVAFLFGDRGAAAMGFSPLGLEDNAGVEHAIALARSSAAGSQPAPSP